MTQAERTALSDSRMFEAATKLICKQGAHNATLSSIGELAGYSRGLASNRFGSKDGLIRELVSFYNDKWAQELAHYIDKRRGLSAFLARIDAVEHFLLKQPDYVRAMYLLWYEYLAANEEVRLYLADWQEKQRTSVERLIIEGINDGSVDPTISPSNIAVQYCAFAFGIIYQIIVSPGSIDIKETFRYYKSTVSALLVPPTYTKRAARA